MFLLVFLVIALQVNLNYANEDIIFHKSSGSKVLPSVPQFNQEKKSVERTTAMKTYSALANQDTCSNNCDATGGLFDSSRSCQCDLLCYSFGDCCADYSQYCHYDVQVDYVRLTNYNNDDQCLGNDLYSVYLKAGVCFPYVNSNNADGSSEIVSYGMSHSLIGQAPYTNFYCKEDKECKGIIVETKTYGEGCSDSTRAAGLTKFYFELLALDYTGFADLIFDSREKAMSPDYERAAIINSYYFYCQDRYKMGVTYSKQPQCINTGSNYVEYYFLGSGCTGTFNTQSASKPIESLVGPSPYPLLGGLYLDTGCFAAANKSPSKYLKTAQTPQAINEKKDLISEVKYNSRPTKF